MSIRDLQNALREKIHELRRRDEIIDELELDIKEKSAHIIKLEGELDTYKKLLKKASIVGRTSSHEKVRKERTKRTAISAECTTNKKIDLNIKRVSKSLS